MSERKDELPEQTTVADLIWHIEHSGYGLAARARTLQAQIKAAAAAGGISPLEREELERLAETLRSLLDEPT
jgi:hypothetical protein